MVCRDVNGGVSPTGAAEFEPVLGKMCKYVALVPGDIVGFNPTSHCVSPRAALNLEDPAPSRAHPAHVSHLHVNYLLNPTRR